jgi:hypothetical protein
MLPSVLLAEHRQASALPYGRAPANAIRGGTGCIRGTLCDMIWRLAHPVRGLLAGLAVWVLAVLAAAKGLGFAVAIPELLIITALAVVATVVVGRSGPKAAMASDRVGP